MSGTDNTRRSDALAGKDAVTEMDRDKILMRMLSPTGNPTASNLFSVLSTVQKAAGVHLAVTAGC